jgi:hypothetical protein
LHALGRSKQRCVEGIAFLLRSTNLLFLGGVIMMMDMKSLGDDLRFRRLFGSQFCPQSRRSAAVSIILHDWLMQ